MKSFALRSLKNGAEYQLTGGDVDEFYSQHIFGCGHNGKGFPQSGWLTDSTRACGSALLKMFNVDGELVDVRAGGNLVVTTGLALVVDRIQGVSGPPAAADYIAVGTGGTAASAGDTALQTEIGTRVQGTLSQPTSATDRAVSTFSAGNGTGALVEMGRLNASSSGTLVARIVFSTITKGASDSLTITHDIIYS